MKIFMPPMSALFVVFLLTGGLAHGEGKFDPAARAKIIAPWIDEQTLAVAHLDLARLSVEPVLDRIAPLAPGTKAELTEIKQQAVAIQQQLVRAGAKDVYVLFTLTGVWPPWASAQLFQGPPHPVDAAHVVHRPSLFAVIPLAPGSDDAIRAVLPNCGVERRGDVLVVVLMPGFASVPRMTPDVRPELVPALEAAGDTAVQVLLLPPKHYRRVLEEAVGEFPKELGGGSMKILTQGMLWAAVGIDVTPRMDVHIMSDVDVFVRASLRMVVQSEDARAARALSDKLAELIRLAGECKEVRERVPNFAELAAVLQPQVEGDRLVLVLDEKNRGIDKVLAALSEATASARASARAMMSENNLKQIALAMYNYYSANGHFPLPASTNSKGKPLLSWRVHILPFLDQDALYRQFHLDEPWDSPHNRTLIDKMPAVYRLPISNRAQKDRTHYLLPVGNGAAFSADRPTKMADITDGTSYTIMVVEVDDQHAAIWTKPEDWPFDPEAPANGLSRFFQGGFHAAFCDGSVHFLPKTIDRKTLKALFTRAGGEYIDPKTLFTPAGGKAVAAGGKAPRSFLGWSLLVINADGSNPHPILTMSDFTRVGSPHWSHDGRKIAFDAWRSVMGEDYPDAHVFVVNADGSEPKDLGAGAMPNWSPDDKQLTYCQYGLGHGVWIMNADGSHRRRIDAGGWGSQWSPKRNEIAYVIYDDRGAVLCIYDVAAEQRREVPHKPYRQVYWGFTWSPDGKRICFKGILPDGSSEIAVISVEGPEHALKVLLPSSALPEVGSSNCTMAWGGTGNQILVTMQRKTDRLPRLYVFDSTGVKPPRLFPKFPADWMSNDMAWSSDGKRVVVSVYPVPLKE